MDYSLASITPNAVLTPTTVDELAAALRAASTERAAVVPWGAGTRQHIGAAPSRYTLALRTASLDQIVEYNPADLVVTVQAGISLAALQAQLAEHGQRLPWDPPVPPEATIGGLLATNAFGPLRLGFGPPRDWTLGMQVVLGDGRPVRSGGKVVKNVAGYDAHKLHIGALGTLGVITEVTFKVAPLPEKNMTILVHPKDIGEALEFVEVLRQPPLEPVSLILGSEFESLEAGSEVVVARFEGTDAALRRLSSIAHQRLGDATTILEGEKDANYWESLAHLAAYSHDGGIRVRLGARPTALQQLTPAIKQIASRFILFGATGLAHIWLNTPNTIEAVARLANLRALAESIGGYAVVENALDHSPAALDIWGQAPPTLPLMHTLKAQWDPQGVLNPGRYAGNL